MVNRGGRSTFSYNLFQSKSKAVLRIKIFTTEFQRGKDIHIYPIAETKKKLFAKYFNANHIYSIRLRPHWFYVVIRYIRDVILFVTGENQCSSWEICHIQKVNFSSGRNNSKKLITHRKFQARLFFILKNLLHRGCLVNIYLLFMEIEKKIDL